MNAIKERPILFSGEMVRAILDGRKTQTRRIAKLKLSPKHSKDFEVCDDPDKFRVDYPVKGCPRLHVPIRHWQNSYVPWDECTADEVACPYEAGMRLWVRETWRVSGDLLLATNGKTLSQTIKLMKARNERCEIDELDICYAADEYTNEHPGEYKPSIFMPRLASRILLEIKDVRVERLNDISRADAIAEGGPKSHPSIDHVSRTFGYTDFSRSWFAQLWESINGPDSWSANPWVWVVEFERIAE